MIRDRAQSDPRASRDTEAAADQRPFRAPDLPYLPQDPSNYNPPIGLIGCGGITTSHLKAYRKADYRVVALCDLDPKRARQRQSEYFPQAEVFTDYGKLLQRPDIEVVDVATHPANRASIVREALLAGKHVLSQKPFVLDLDEGQRLVELAAQQKVYLAVNQNARWAPHYRYAALAIQRGLLGQLSAVHMSVHWDHGWVAGTEFERVKHLILYDYAIHWFDLIRYFFPDRSIQRVYASTARSRTQAVTPALLGQAVVELDGAQVSLAFDADTHYGPQDRTIIVGDRGTLRSEGPSNRIQRVWLATAHGQTDVPLQGCWFPDGFHGTMGELLCSIEQQRSPSISASSNLESLALCFAAVASAERHEPVKPGSVRRLPS